jgi:hypothetical protein
MWLSRILAAEWRSPWAVISPGPRALQAARSRKYRHEINGNYYAIKKIRGKIKTHALRSESRIAITDKKLADRKPSECITCKGKTNFQPLASVLPDTRPVHLPQGLLDAKLGWFHFPELQGGEGKANDIFGSVYGWLVSKDAPKEVIDFMKVWLGKDVQTKLAAEGLSIPMVIITADAIQNLFYKSLALEVNKTDWIGLAMDQLLGRETGRVFNDEALAVAAGAKSPGACRYGASRPHRPRRFRYA